MVWMCPSGVLMLACPTGGTTGSGILTETRIKPHANMCFFPLSSLTSPQLKRTQLLTEAGCSTRAAVEQAEPTKRLFFPALWLLTLIHLNPKWSQTS